MNCDYSQKFPKVHLESIGFWVSRVCMVIQGGINSLEIDFQQKTQNQPVRYQSIDHASFSPFGGKRQSRQGVEGPY
jgi:hypothetical protein